MIQTLETEILDLMQRYLAVPTDTATALEAGAAGFIRDCLASEAYFRDHPDHQGASLVPDDPLGRSVSWALVRGSAPATVVLLHHSDTVGTEDYRHLAGSARNPAVLAAALRAERDALSPEARADLDSGAFLFGHGACDMKGGAAIQLALLRRFCREPDREGSLLLLAVPDEENLSLGMRHGAEVLDALRRRFGLEYRLMINSEPHTRTDPEVGVLSEGSVGKILPFIYARGVAAHAGQVFTGLNPVSLLIEAVRRIELDPELCDRHGGEVTLPPTCLFLKDSKTRYDVTLPRSAFACFNVLCLDRSPADLLVHLERTCAAAAGQVLADVGRSHARYRSLRDEPAAPLPWRVPVLRFQDLAVPAGPDPDLERAVQNVRQGLRTMPQATWDLVEGLLDRTGRQGPLMVLGFIPPYYPSVTNAAFGGPGARGTAVAAHLVRFAADSLGQRWTTEAFFTGISDLSYSSLQHGPDLERTVVPNMPLHGPAYTLPFPAIRANAMPCINIGPWGKDFHQLTERVHRQDLLVATPRLIQEAIRFMFEQDS
ncbi:MAG: M20/M25/M40 family metallo-hydrolase [Holophaga sp.]|jgi:arginine utilization protein RocB